MLRLSRCRLLLACWMVLTLPLQGLAAAWPARCAADAVAASLTPAATQAKVQTLSASPREHGLAGPTVSCHQAQPASLAAHGAEAESKDELAVGDDLTGVAPGVPTEPNAEPSFERSTGPSTAASLASGEPVQAHCLACGACAACGAVLAGVWPVSALNLLFPHRGAQAWSLQREVAHASPVLDGLERPPRGPHA